MSVCSDVDVNSASPCCIALGSCLAKSSDKFLQAFHVLVFKDWRYQFAFFAVRSCNTDILLEFPFSAVRIPCAPCFVAISSCCVLVSACAEEISGKLGGFLTGNAVHLNLNVTQGVEEQPIVSPYFKRRKKRALSTGEYVEGILAGNITTLSQAITLVESSNPNHYAQAQEIIEACLPHAGKSVRIGITGVPGAGKSTFIEAIGNMVAGLRHKLAVLAIDPSSERSGGSILGDKTRMESICNNPSVFVRPSPSAGSLGGVARKTRETIVLCEAAGFDVIFIETVGVGQSETAVHSMVDLFMLLQISGAGDELQGIKRGIMEMADLMVITKADGENIHKAELAQTQFQGALRLFPVPESGWRPKVYTSSAVARTGLEEVWKGVEEYLDHIQKNGYFQHNRNRQNKYWMYESINEALRGSFYRDPAVEACIGAYEKRVLEDKISSFIAAKELLEIYFKDARTLE